MKGEAVASGSVHVDNIAPSLFGGLVLTVGIDNPNVKQIPVPTTVRCVLVHPHMMLSTREARQILNRSIDLSDVIWQSANLAGFLTGCFTGDLQLIRESLEDVIIEPQRQVLIPGFQAVKEGAMAQRRARLLDFGRRADGIRVVRAAGCRTHSRCDGRRLHGPPPRKRCVDLDARSGRRAHCRITRPTDLRAPLHAVHQHPQRRTRCDARRGHCARHRAGRRVVRSRGVSALHCATVRRPTSSCRRSASGCWRRSPRAIRWPRELGAICREAFDFPAPLVQLPNAPAPLSVLELFHGPTCAFKDFGARFLAACMERIRRDQRRKLTILVATSGDTGGAVAAAFHGKPWVDVAVLYPKGKVSQRQAQQLACWGGNVRTFAVRGTFDDCQRIVKEAFVDPALAETHQLSSANSINIGRLLPQMVYYAKAGLQLWRETGRRANFIVPTGNLGNSLACIWARHVGMPIGEIVLATNANQSDHRVPAHRRMGAAPERRDARVRDGRRQSEQHGAAARAASGFRGAAGPDRRVERR